MKRIPITAVILAVVTTISVFAFAKDRSDMTRVEKIVSAAAQTIELRDKVCPRSSNPSECVREHDWSVVLHLYYAARQLRHQPSDAAWPCDAACKEADSYLERLRTKYSGVDTSALRR